MTLIGLAYNQKPEPTELASPLPESVRQERPDIVFNIAEGFRGVNREAHVPAICEFYGTPYTGSDPFTLTLCLDKARAKETLAFHGIPTPRFAVVNNLTDIESRTADQLLPLFVKPLPERSSKGITDRNLWWHRSQLLAQPKRLRKHYRQPVLVEE